MKLTELKINDHITCYLTPKTAKAIKAEIEAREREAEMHETLFRAMQTAWQCGDMDAYSDFYKDLYGVRPR